MMKRTKLWLYPLFLSMLILTSSCAVGTVGQFGGTSAAPSVRAAYALVMDANTGEILLDKNADKRAYPASTTKIMTALLALEYGTSEEWVTAGKEVRPQDPEESRAGLRHGQRLKLFDLVEAALLPSGNDAARTIAVHIGRKTSGDPWLDEEEAQRWFVKLMNERAQQMGAKQTRFANPSGLHDPKHYSTARDLALIARTAMSNKHFRQAVGATDYAAVAVRGEASDRLALTNTNQLLHKDSAYYLEGATGVKTGFTDQAGYCLVSSVSRDGKRLIAVVLRSTSKDVYPDARQLLQYGLEHVSPVRTVASGTAVR